MASEEVDQSEWNYAKAYLMRVDEAFRLANKSSVLDDYDNWYDALEVLYREVYPQMSEERKIVIKELLREAISYIKIPSGKRNGISYTIREKLGDVEVLIRQSLTDAGMDIPKKYDPKKAMRQ